MNERGVIDSKITVPSESRRSTLSPSKKFIKILGLILLWMILPFTAFAKMQEVMDDSREKNKTK